MLSVSVSVAGASPADPWSAAKNDEPRPPSWSVELDLAQPLIPKVHIGRLRATRTLWGTARGGRGELLAGIYLRPYAVTEVVHVIHEYMASVGYRQYFWRGLHADAVLDAGAAWGTNRFDGRFYRTATLFADFNAGYRFDVYAWGADERGPGVAVFVTPQVGVLTTLGVADLGPRHGNPDTFAQGMLLVGASF